YLVLNAYEPSIWRVGVAPGAEIKGVMVFGYYDQVLAGIPPSVPVVKHIYERDAHDWSKCLLSHGDGGGGVFSRNAAVEADSIARAQFGKGFDSVAFTDDRAPDVER